MDDIIKEIEKIEDLFINANYQEAFEAFNCLCELHNFDDLKNSANIILSRYNSLCIDDEKGIIPLSDKVVQKNQIADSFLSCMKRLKDHLRGNNGIKGLTIEENMPIRSYYQEIFREKRKKRIAISSGIIGMMIVYIIILFYNINKCKGKEHIDPLTCMEFVLVQGKEFEMGCVDGDHDCLENEKIIKDTEIIKGFWIGKYEVTQGQWKKVMPSNSASFQKGDDYPVETVGWNDIQEFIRRLNEKTGRKYRLPTEAEWEFVCRNRGENDIFSGGKDLSQIGNYAWYGENSQKSTHIVGTKQPNDLGAYDMSGNTEEWCQNVYDNPDIYPPGMEPHRVIRGGSWKDSRRYLRCTFRRQAIPAQAENTVGFRLARDCY